MLTVVFATYNGERTLPRCLEAMTHLRAPSTGWNVLAVDNGSTDRSAEILGSFAGRLPLRVLQQPARGKNRALNLAMSHLEGDLVAFTDDDTIPDREWLCELAGVASRKPEYDLFGGAILPQWESEPPAWVIAAVPPGVTFALTAPDLAEGDIYPGLIWGPNMMVRRKVFDAGHRFEENVGPGQGQYIMGSETEFNIRMAALGYRACFTPRARVRHIIRSYQLDESWIIMRAFRFGRSLRMQDRAPDIRKQLFGAPRWMYRRASAGGLRGVWSLVRGDRIGRMTAFWEASRDVGYIHQSYLQRHHRTGPGTASAAARLGSEQAEDR